MEPVFRLVQGKPARPVEHLADLLAAASRQAMYRDRSRSSQLQQSRAHLAAGKRGEAGLNPVTAPASQGLGSAEHRSERP